MIVMNKKTIALLLAALFACMTFASCSLINGGGSKKDADNSDVKVVIESITQIPVSSIAPIDTTEPVLDTPAPTDTPAPNITPPPVITPPPAPNYHIFENCAFVGNSIFEGLRQYGFIPYGHFFTRVGLNILTVYTQTTTNGHIPVIDELNTGSYAAVIMMFGQNELGWPNLNTFIDKYEQFLRDVWRRQPNAKLFIMGSPPVSAERSATSTTGVTNENIHLYNAQLEDLCARTANCYYISIPEVLVTASGALPNDASGDGIHLNKTYSKLWSDHICLTVMSILYGGN